MSPSSDRWLRRGALALTLTLAASVTATFAVVMWPRVARAVGYTPPPPEPAYRAGQTIDAPAEWRQPSGPTLVVFAQSACGACQKAQPFFKALFKELDGRAAVILASHGPNRPEESKYGHAMGLPETSIKVTPRDCAFRRRRRSCSSIPRERSSPRGKASARKNSRAVIREKILALIN